MSRVTAAAGLGSTIWNAVKTGGSAIAIPAAATAGAAIPLLGGSALWGQNSLLGAGLQNIAGLGGTNQSIGRWTGIREGIANFLELLRTVIPALNEFEGIRNLETRLRSNVDRHAGANNVNVSEHSGQLGTMAAGAGVAGLGTYLFSRSRGGPSGGPTGGSRTGFNAGGDPMDILREAHEGAHGAPRRAPRAAGGRFSGLMSRLSGLGRFGRVATTVALVGGISAGALSLSGSAAEAGTLPAGDITTPAPEATSIADEPLMNDIADGAHAFAHGFCDTLTDTASWLTGSVLDIGDEISGRALGAFGVDTGYDTRNISAEFQAATDELTTTLIGAPDLDTAFAQAMHGAGGLASYFVGPGAVAFARIGAAGSGLATTFRVASSSTSFTARAAGITAQAGVGLSMPAATMG